MSPTASRDCSTPSSRSSLSCHSRSQKAFTIFFTCQGVATDMNEPKEGRGQGESGERQ